MDHDTSELRVTYQAAPFERFTSTAFDSCVGQPIDVRLSTTEVRQGVVTAATVADDGLSAEVTVVFPAAKQG